MEKKYQSREERGEEMLRICRVAYTLLQEPTPERAALMLLLKGLFFKYSYASYESVMRHIDITEHGLKIMIGRLKGDGLVVEEDGFIRLTKDGLAYTKHLMGISSVKYMKYKRRKERK